MKSRLVTGGLLLPEAPVCHPDGSISVGEILGGRIRHIDVGGLSSIIAETGGGPNGAALGPDGAMYVCNNGGSKLIREVAPDGKTVLRPPTTLEVTPRIGGQIQRVSTEGNVTTLYSAADGRDLMSPNDIVFDRAGGFYFTDIGYSQSPQRKFGLPETGADVGVLHMHASIVSYPPGSVYYASHDGSKIREVLHPLSAPNGIGLSPDEATLYVAESGTGRLWAFEIAEPGVFGSRQCLGIVPGVFPSNFAFCDSLAVDEEGSILVATIGNGGITIFSPKGGVIEHIPTGDPITTNCCFGGQDFRTLFVTLGGRGELVAYDSWRTRGLKPNFLRDQVACPSAGFALSDSSRETS